MSVKLGNLGIKGINIGSSKIKNVYIGSQLIYSSVKEYTLTLASGVGANRTSSPSGMGSIGSIASGAKIYEGDTLTFSAVTRPSKNPTYTAWYPTASDWSLSVTPCTGANASAYCNVTLTNNTGTTIGMSRLLIDPGSGEPMDDIYIGESSSSTSFIDSDNLYWNEIWEYCTWATQKRTKTTYSYSLSSTSATVNSNISVSWVESSSNTQESQTVYGPSKTVTLPSQNKYAVSFTKGDYINSVYVSTNDKATSGSPSGTRYGYGSTVYLFASITNTQYNQCSSNIPSSWTLVGGGTGSTRYYRIDSVTNLSADKNFGTISLTLNKYTITYTKATTIDHTTITIKDNNGSTLYNGNYSANTTFSNIPYGSTITWYSVASTTSNCYIPADTSSATITGNKTIAPKAASVRTSTTTRSGDRTSYKSLLSITSTTYIQSVDVVNSTSTTRTCYIGYATSSTGTPSTFITNGGTVAKNSTGIFAARSTKSSGYITWKLDSGTWTISNVKATVYYFVSADWSLG